MLNEICKPNCSFEIQVHEIDFPIDYSLIQRHFHF